MSEERDAEKAFLRAWENAAPLKSVSWADFQEIKRVMVPLIAAHPAPPAVATCSNDGESNPFVAMPCGRLFDTYEDMAEHVREHHADQRAAARDRD